MNHRDKKSLMEFGIISIVVLIFGLVACSGPQTIPPQAPIEHTLKIEVISEDGEPKEVQLKDGDKVMRSMSVRPNEYQLSQLSAMYNEEKLYIKIFSGLSVADVTRAWQDMIVAIEEYNFGEGSEVHLFIDSPGGDAFAGLALADLIEKYSMLYKIKFIAHGTGIIASAAVPVFAVCDETHATQATIFMVHEAALWKWPGRETASDIRSQNRLMDLLQILYLDKLVKNSNLNFDQWEEMEGRTSWFSTWKAKEIGILDFIDNESKETRELLIEKMNRKNDAF